MKKNLLRILWAIAAAALSIALPILATELNRPTIEDYWVEIYYPENIIRQEDKGAMHRAYWGQYKRDYGSIWTGSLNRLSPSKAVKPYTGDICSVSIEKTVFSPGEIIIMQLENNTDEVMYYDTYRLEVLMDGTWYYLFSGGWGYGGQASLGLSANKSTRAGLDMRRGFRTPVYDESTDSYTYGSFERFNLWPGHYRVSISLSAETGRYRYTHYPFSAEFDVVGVPPYKKKRAEDEATHPMLDYWTELFGANSIGKSLSTGDYYILAHDRYHYEGVDYESIDMYSLEQNPGLYGTELFPSATNKDTYSPGETINVTIRNDSGTPFRMDAGDYRIEYLLDGQWYAIRPGEYSTGLLFDDLQIIGDGGEVTISVTPENLRQYPKVALDPETGLYEPLPDEPVILRPGRYRFALSIQTDTDFDHLAESPEYLVGCEFEVE